MKGIIAIVARTHSCRGFHPESIRAPHACTADPPPAPRPPLPQLRAQGRALVALTVLPPRKTGRGRTAWGSLRAFGGRCPFHRRRARPGSTLGIHSVRLPSRGWQHRPNVGGCSQGRAVADAAPSVHAGRGPRNCRARPTASPQ